MLFLCFPTKQEYYRSRLTINIINFYYADEYASAMTM